MHLPLCRKWKPLEVLPLAVMGCFPFFLLHRFRIPSVTLYSTRASQFKAMRMDNAYLVADGEGGVLGFTAARALRFRGVYVSYANVSGGGVRWCNARGPFVRTSVLEKEHLFPSTAVFVSNVKEEAEELVHGRERASSSPLPPPRPQPWTQYSSHLQ